MRYCVESGCGTEDIKNGNPELGHAFVKQDLAEPLHSAGFDFGQTTKDLTYLTEEETSYFAIALNHNSIDSADFIYKNYPGILDSKNSQGQKISILRLVLSNTRFNNKMKPLQYLKKIGFDFKNERDQFGNTGLHHIQFWKYDAHQRHYLRSREHDAHQREVSKFLLEEGVDPFVKNKEGDTVFDVGHRRNKKVIRKWLKEKREQKQKNKNTRFF